MTDPYRISATTDRPVQRTDAPGNVRRVLLWITVFACAAANAISSASGLNPFIGSTFGVVSLAAVAALIANHRRTRQS